MKLFLTLFFLTISINSTASTPQPALKQISQSSGEDPIKILPVESEAEAESTCISAEEMTQIATHFTQFSQLAGKEFCLNNSHESYLLSGIVFMRKTQFSASERSKDELFSGSFASNWWNYFIGRIDQFTVDDSCPKGVAAYVYAWGGKTMFACTGVLGPNFTSLDLASVFMHEARHIDGYPHVTCSQGPRAGLQGACDRRISDGGSYAVTVETYAQLARYAVDIHPALKAYARSSAVVYADETFQTPARVDRSLRFLVLAKDKRFHTVELGGSSQALGLAPELGRIFMRGQHMILIPDNTNNLARFAFARGEGEIASQAGDQAGEYNGLAPKDRPNLVDIHVAAQWNARVYKDKVRFDCDPRAKVTKEIALADLPVGLLYPNGYDRASSTISLMTDSGKVYDLGCSASKQPFLQSSTSFSFDQKYVSMYKVGGLILGLTSDGFLREIQGSTSRPFSIGDLDGNIRELAPNQAVEFFGER